MYSEQLIPAVRRAADIPAIDYERCHDGKGTLICRSLLDGLGSRAVAFMHHDLLPCGVSIGSHDHLVNEEVYYLVSGEGILLFNGIEYPFRAGDVSLCSPGHSHGFSATSPEGAVLVVVGSAEFERRDMA